MNRPIPGTRVKIVDVAPPEYEGHASWYARRSDLIGRTGLITYRGERLLRIALDGAPLEPDAVAAVVGYFEVVAEP